MRSGHEPALKQPVRGPAHAIVKLLMGVAPALEEQGQPLRIATGVAREDIADSHLEQLRPSTRLLLD